MINNMWMLECEGFTALYDDWPIGTVSASKIKEGTVTLFSGEPEKPGDVPLITVEVRIDDDVAGPDTNVGAEAILELEAARALRDALSTMIEELERQVRNSTDSTH